MATNAGVEPCPFCQGWGFSRWQFKLPVTALHTSQRFLLSLCSSFWISLGACLCAFTGKAGAVCDDLSLIRSYEVIQEVLQNICWSHFLHLSVSLSLVVFAVHTWNMIVTWLVPVAGHGNKTKKKSQNTRLTPWNRAWENLFLLSHVESMHVKHTARYLKLCFQFILNSLRMFLLVFPLNTLSHNI